MAELAGIYLQLIGARVRSQLQYRVSFVLQLAGAFCMSFIDFLVVLVIFQHLPALAGWSLGQIAFLYGISSIAFQLTDLVIGQLDQLPQQILQGDFDIVLIRPLGSLFQMAASDFQLRRLGSMGQGLAVLIVALVLAPIDWTPARAVMLLVMPLSGSVIFAAVWVLGATTTFWTVRTMEIVNAFTYGGKQLTSYPMPIYGEWLRRFFTFVLPLAFVDYLPALYILGKPDPLGLPGIVRFSSPLVAAAMAVIAWQVWEAGIRHYRSTGS